MIDFDLTRWQEELSVAESFRDQHLTHWDDMVDRMTGPDFAGHGDDMGDPENFVHQYIALVLPRLVYDNPRVRVTSRTPEQQLIFQSQLQAAVNSWCRLTNVRDTLVRVATDMMIAFGVTMVVDEPSMGMRVPDSEQPWIPRLYRIDPHDFVIDPQSTHVEDARYMAHSYRCDIDDLLARADTEDGWDTDAIENVASDKDSNDARRLSGREGPDRRQVTVYEIWIPEWNLGEELIDAELDTNLHNGSIVTIIRGQANSDGETKYGFARDPQPYYGPSTGPYQIYGCYNVPGDPYPLSPLVPLLPQISDLNDHLRSLTHSASTYKRIIATDSRNQKLANDIRDRDDLSVVLVDGIDPSQIVPIELGGITAQQVQYSSISQDRLDRVSGIHDAMRGNITGQATATEINVAESAASLRMSHLKREFQAKTAAAMRASAWYMFHDGKIQITIGDEIPYDPVFTGGSGVGLFDDMVIEVDAYSMSRVSEVQQQKRAIELLQVIGGLSQQMATAPWVDWRQVLQSVGDSMNVPELGSMMDPSKLLQAQQQAMALQGAGEQNGAAPQPSPNGNRR